MLPVQNLDLVIALLQASGKLGPGRTFFVGNGTAQHQQLGASNNNSGLNPKQPLSTIDYAVGLCTAGRNDNIVVLPAHSEDITTAGAIALDVAGVTLYGMGSGASRPTITCSGTTDTLDINVTGANTRIFNFIFDMTGNDAVDAFLDIDAADVGFYGCRFLLQGSSGQVNIGVDVGTGSHRCTFEDCVFFGDTAGASTDTAITVSAAVSQFTMRRCIVDMIGGASPGCIEFTAAALNIHLERCFFANRVASATTTIDFNANACTGQMIDCHHLLGTIATAGSGILPLESTGQAAYIGIFESFCVNDQAAAGAGESGALIGAVST